MERREGARPQSAYMSSEAASSTPGRNRLQRKSDRIYGQHVGGGGGGGPESTPLAPISSNSPYQGYQDGGGGFVPRASLPRAQTVDFATENGYGAYSSGGGSPGGYRALTAQGPPTPAKVPLGHSRSGGGGGGRGEEQMQMQVQMQGAPQENAWALLEEMKSIDLGSGRARRRHGGGVA